MPTMPGFARRWWRATTYLVVEAAAGVVSLALLPAAVLLAVLTVIGPGWFVAPHGVRLLRRWAGPARTRTGRFLGEPVPQDYPEIPTDPTFTDTRRLLTAPSTRRDAAWLLLHALLAPIAGVLAVGLPLAAVNSLVVPAYWSALPPDEPVSNPFPVTSWAAAATMPVVAVAYAAVSIWLSPAMARGLAVLTRRLLAPARESVLAARVGELTESRAAALDAHAAELRRIERDLHDGAQNRLVGVVMMLGLAERSLSANPAQALPQLARAQEAAAEALASLRTVVHDIYPPILDELGLDGALSALAGRCAVPCVLDADGLGRAPAAVESAAYFVVAEALTNVVKHSGAARVSVRVRTATGGARQALSIEVVDDGAGGARERDGGGLAGIRRRARAFEGAVNVSSPVGGPTRVRVELPCG